jgi:hypothetical protein
VLVDKPPDLEILFAKVSFESQLLSLLPLILKVDVEFIVIVEALVQQYGPEIVLK